MSIIMHGEIHGFTDRALWFPLKVDINLSARLNIITTNSLNMQSLKAKQNKTKKTPLSAHKNMGRLKLANFGPNTFLSLQKFYLFIY